MKSFKDYVLVQEASINRLKKHLDNHDAILFVTGSRHENTPKQNNENLADLKRYVRLAGFGFNEVTGHYPEEGQDVVEKSLIVYAKSEQEEELFNLGLSLGKKFDQSSVLFVDSKGEAHFVSTRPDSWVGSVGSKMRLGKFTRMDDNTIEKAFTKIKGKKFKFDSVSEETKSRVGQYNDYVMCEQFKNVIQKYGSDCIQKWDMRITKAR